MIGDEDDPPDDVDLYRTAWHPEHLDEGGFTGTSAFRKDDLTGGDGFVSVDRSDRFNEAVAQTRAREQQNREREKTKPGEPVKKEEAVVLELPCAGVREAVDDKGAKPFSVTGARRDDNPAHCAIRNVTGIKGKSYINQLRLILLKLVLRERLLMLSEPEASGEVTAGES